MRFVTNIDASEMESYQKAAGIAGIQIGFGRATSKRGEHLPDYVSVIVSYGSRTFWGILTGHLCPGCGGGIEREDYLNACANAGCKLNGQHTYHLGCGSQYREYCADCNAILFDSAQDEIANTEWREEIYICQQCEAEGIQPGHFACGERFQVPA